MTTQKKKDRNTSDSINKMNSSKSANNSFFIERNDYLLPSSQIDKYNIDSYVNTNPNRTMFKLHAVPIDIEDNNEKSLNYNSYSNNSNSFATKKNNVSQNRAQSTSSIVRNNNNNSSLTKNTNERPKSPTMLVDLVINTPKSDIKIQRKCKSYEVSSITIIINYYVICGKENLIIRFLFSCYFIILFYLQVIIIFFFNY